MPDVGDRIADTYVIEGVLGEGGMGRVYRASHVLIGHSVAVKVMKPRARPGGTFLHEARLTARITGGVPHVVACGTLPNGLGYLVMEHLVGCDLQRLLRRHGRFAPSDAVTCILQACTILGAAHAAGVTHRDVKPSNLFLVHGSSNHGAPQLRVLDFGIASARRDDGAFARAPGDASSALGSPAFAPPEGNDTPQTDIWSLGVTLFMLVTGALPFAGTSTRAVRAAVEDGGARSLRDLRADVDPLLDAVVARCLARDPAQRFASTGELAAALTPFARAPCTSDLFTLRLPTNAEDDAGVANVSALREAATQTIDEPPATTRRAGAKLGWWGAILVVASLASPTPSTPSYPRFRPSAARPAMSSTLLVANTAMAPTAST